MRYVLSYLFLFSISPCYAQLMDRAWEQKLKNATPKIEGIVFDFDSKDAKWLFYTRAEMPPAFQHLRDGGMYFFSLTHNFSGNRAEKVGNANEFPWNAPGGSHASNIYSWKAIRLPAGTKIKVFWNRDFFHYNSIYQGKLSGFSHGGYDWIFPKGTKVFEFQSFSDKLLVYEVRMREKKEDGRWKTVRYFPYKSTNDFWADGGTVSRSVREELTDKIHPTNSAFSSTAVVDYVCKFDREVIKTKTFVRSAWAPSTEVDSIVPRWYKGAFVVGRCQSCHDQTAVHTGFFDLRRDWYGHVPGSKTDNNFSFNPIEPSSISGDGIAIVVRFRQALIDAGILEIQK